jgi:hypothetical protein
MVLVVKHFLLRYDEDRRRTDWFSGAEVPCESWMGTAGHLKPNPVAHPEAIGGGPHFDPYLLWSRRSSVGIARAKAEYSIAHIRGFAAR